MSLRSTFRELYATAAARQRDGPSRRNPALFVNRRRRLAGTHIAPRVCYDAPSEPAAAPKTSQKPAVGMAL